MCCLSLQVPVSGVIWLMFFPKNIYILIFSNFSSRIWHVTICSAICQVLEREVCLLQDCCIWLLQGSKRVINAFKIIKQKVWIWQKIFFHQICRKDGGTLRQMSSDKLIKTLPTLQNQLDALLDFDVSTSDLTNGVINSAFMLLFRDLIRLFACYNDGIINILGNDETNRI